MEGQVPHARPDRERLTGGVVLIIIGGALLAAQLIPDVGRFIVLGIGLALLAAFVLTRAYGWLVAGSIVTGVGVGVLLAATFPGEQSGAALMLSIGGGFLAIWAISMLLSLAERHWWPLVPGSILASIGAALAIGDGAVELLNYWPVVLIAIGVLLLVGAVLGSRKPPVSRLGGQG